MEFKDIVMKRYAVKKFDGRKVPEDRIAQLLEIAKYAPTSYNIQPWKVVVVSDPAIREKLAKAAEGNRSQLTTCSHLLIFCANTDITGNAKAIEKQLIAGGAKKEDISGYINAMIGVGESKTPEQRLSWAQRQTFMPFSFALNAAISLGFDSSPMEGMDNAAFAKILGLPENIYPTVMCALGYAADKPTPKLRLPDKELILKK